jgi:hypothetical protein
MVPPDSINIRIEIPEGEASYRERVEVGVGRKFWLRHGTCKVWTSLGQRVNLWIDGFPGLNPFVLTPQGQFDAYEIFVSNHNLSGYCTINNSIHVQRSGSSGSLVAEIVLYGEFTA